MRSVWESSHQYTFTNSCSSTTYPIILILEACTSLIYVSCYTNWSWLLSSSSRHLSQCMLSKYMLSCSSGQGGYMLWIILLLTKWRIALSVHTGVLESLKNSSSSMITISSECNTQWFMLLACVLIVVIASAVIVLSWRRKESKKIDDLPVLVTCRSGTLAMLSSKVNGPVAHGSIR